MKPSHEQGWDVESVLEAIRTWAHEYGDPPRLLDWNPGLARHQNRPDLAERFEELEPRFPPSYRVRQLCGSWNAALTAAGYRTTQAGLKRSTGRAHTARGQEYVTAWSLDEILDALRSEHRERGRPPTFEEWVPGDPTGRRPSAQTVQTAAGSWNRALELAGLPVGRRGSGRRVDTVTRVEAVARYLNEESSTDLAHELGVSSSAVLRWVTAAGHQTRPRTTATDAATRDRAVARYLNGEPSAALAHELGVNSTTVTRWVTAAGHRARPGARAGRAP